MLLIICIIIALVLSLFTVLIIFSMPGSPNYFSFVIVAIPNLVLWSFGISKLRKRRRLKRSKKRFGAMEAAECKHVSGLPLAEGAICTVLLLPQEFLFFRAETQVHLPFEKVLDVACKTEEEIRNSYVSNIGDAVAGYAAFGTTGAILGGQPEKITDKKKTRYLTIAYDNGGQTAGIVLDSTNAGGKDKKMERYFHGHKAAGGGKNIQL